MRHALFLTAFLFMPVGGTVVAQAASYSYLPQPAPYWNPFPAYFTALNTPRVGATFEVSAPGLHYGCTCQPPSHFLLTGFSNPGIDLTPIFAPNGGVLMSSAEVVLDRASAIGPQFTVSFPIPNDPFLIGVHFFQQVAYVFNSPVYGPSILLGRGGHGIIGT